MPDPDEQDPDLPIENVISVISGMCLEEEIPDGSQDNEVTKDAQEQCIKPSDQNSAKVESPKKELKKNKEKLIKTEDKAILSSPCSWDLKGQEIGPNFFSYKFEATIFRGKKVCCCLVLIWN